MISEGSVSIKLSLMPDRDMKKVSRGCIIKVAQVSPTVLEENISHSCGKASL